MGRYIQNLGTTFEEKLKTLASQYGSSITDSEFKEDLVCVVDNGDFAAVAYIGSTQERNHFAQEDGRRKRWLVVPNAEELADE